MSCYLSQDGHGEVQLSIQTIRRSSISGSVRKKSGRDKKAKLDRSQVLAQYDSSPDGKFCILIIICVFNAYYYKPPR